MNKNVPTPFIDTIIGFGPGGPLPSPSPWRVLGGYIDYVAGGVVVGTPTGGNLGPGTLNAVGLYINGLSFNLNNYLPLAGGTITGPLTINGNFTMNGVTDGIILDMGTF
jgi:hypothetical protein